MMVHILVFIGGMMLGGTLGVMFMCLFQINREDCSQKERGEKK